MDWERITRGKPKVVGSDTRWPGLLDVRIELSATPPREWAEAFAHPPSFSISMHPPRLEGRTVRLTPPDQELEKYVEHVDACIANANEQFERVVLPQLREEAERAQAADTARDQRIREAQARADNL